MLRRARACVQGCPRAWVMVACVCSSCSLLDLGDFDLKECTETPDGSPCEVQNRAHGVSDSACVRYQCTLEGPGCEPRPKDSDNDGKADARVCASEVSGELDCDDEDPNRAPGKQEVWDGKDNDCDGDIDEQLVPPPAPISFKFASGTDLGFVEALQVGDDSFYVLSGEKRQRGWKLHLLVFERGELTPRSSDSQVEITLADPDAVSDAGACLQLRDEQPSRNACGFEEAALTALGGPGTSLLTAAIDMGSSTLGVLRAGVLVSGQSSSQLRLGSADRASPLDLGIGLKHPGAQLPRLIARPGSRSEALLVWQTVGRRANGAACAHRALDACEDLAADGCSSETDILTLGIGTHTMGDTLALDALGEVAGERIGSGRRVAPAVATWKVREAEGYLVAYAAESGIELYSRPWFASTAPRRDLRGALATGGSVTGIALGPASPVSQESFRPAAVAWRTGCKERSSIQLARLELSPDQAEWSASATALLRTGTSVVAGPWIAHTPSGLRQPKQARAASSGGWFVTWLEERSANQRALMLRRVAEVDGEPVGDAVELAVGSIPFAFLFTSAGGAIRYGYVESSDLSSTTLRMGEAASAPPDR